MKKSILILVNVLLVALLCVSSFYLYKVLQNRQITQFIKEKESHLLVHGQYEVENGNIGHRHLTVCFPKDSEGNRIVPVEILMRQQIKDSLGSNKPTGEIDELVFVSTSDMSTNIPGVRRTEISSQTYKVSGFKFQSLGKKKSRSILLTAANQRFSLSDLLADFGKGKALFTERIKTDLEAKQVAPEQVGTYLTAFEQMDLQQAEFSYEASQVILHLSEQAVGLSQVTVNISSFFDMVNGQYLTDTDRQAYEAYQAEKQRQATERMVALTFDDGPNPKTTPMLLDILKKYNAKATFFILGQNIPGNEEIVKRMVAEGHEVANHSWSHPNFKTLSPEQIKQEVEQTQSALEKITGRRPTMIRPPYGSVNQMVMDAMNLPAMYWSVDSLDWKSRDPKAILEVVKANTRPGSIILMHDIHQSTVDSMDSVLQHLQAQGYSLDTLPNLLGPNLDPKLIYYDRDSRRPAQ